jgi:hypothetical protein
MLISNNLLTFTLYPDGTHHLEKSLALRTFSTTSSHNIVPLEQKPHLLSLLQVAEATNMAKKSAAKAFKEFSNDAAKESSYIIKCSC